MQSSEVWFVTEGDTVSISLNSSRQKMKNLLAHPAASLLILDLGMPYRYLELRGDAEVSPDPDYVFAGTRWAPSTALTCGFMTSRGRPGTWSRSASARVNAVNMRG